MTNEAINISESTPSTQVAVGSSSGDKIDINHAFYRRSSNSPRMGLVSITFDGRGYQGWKKSMLLALSEKNKLGFITGAHPSPAPKSADLQP